MSESIDRCVVFDGFGHKRRFLQPLTFPARFDFSRKMLRLTAEVNAIAKATSTGQIKAVAYTRRHASTLRNFAENNVVK